MISIPLSAPDINSDDIEAVNAVLRSGRLSLGPKLSEFEKQFASYVGTKHAIAVSSGTAALHLCIRALTIQEGDEVITTPFSFIASANCMLFEKAKPVFVDIEPNTFCIDPKNIEAAITERTKAILAVDIFGHLADWDALKLMAKKHNLALIEDSCEALGTRRGKRQAGTFADCGTFAFYPNKQMTTGEGGMIVTDRDDIADSARKERNQGRNNDSSWLEHHVLGFNYRISDINCALGISQLRRLPEFIAKRQRVTEWYAEELSGIRNEIIPPQKQEEVEISWFVYVPRLHERYSQEDRDRLLGHLRANGVSCNNYFPPLHLQPLYRKKGYCHGDFPITEHIASRTIALPFHANLTQEEVASVCNILKDGLRLLSQ
jgi:perosamine synthetase